MKIAEQVSITLTEGEHKGKTLLVDVEEFQPIEPSNYCYTAGWNCSVTVKGEDIWFFVDELGDVWSVPENDERSEKVGICPVQEIEFKKRVEHDEAMEVLAEKFAAQDREV